MTTSWRLRRRSTAARKAPRNAFSRAESPYTVASSVPSTNASSTTYTARPSAANAPRSSSARRLLPLYGSPQNTTSGILTGRGHVQPGSVRAWSLLRILPVSASPLLTFCFSLSLSLSTINKH
uniref:Uncharacterized protein n=1 Tax=Panthera leo TaxID=9689 RepID=A0A8C8Y5Q4_PANLE